MSIKITLTINVGNDAMLSDHDVANALDGVAQRFRAAKYVQTVMDEGERQGYSVDRGIMDGLGNTVGEFHVTHVGAECEGCGRAATTNRHDEPVCSSCAKNSDAIDAAEKESDEDYRMRLIECDGVGWYTAQDIGNASGTDLDAIGEILNCSRRGV